MKLWIKFVLVVVCSVPATRFHLRTQRSPAEVRAQAQQLLRDHQSRVRDAEAMLEQQFDAAGEGTEQAQRQKYLAVQQFRAELSRLRSRYQQELSRLRP